MIPFFYCTFLSSLPIKTFHACCFFNKNSKILFPIHKPSIHWYSKSFAHRLLLVLVESVHE